jgi:hypothetical protein
MRRHEIPPELNSAKHEAVEQLLGRAPVVRSRRTWAVRPYPDHNVVGVGVGQKIKRGRAIKRRCVRIYVERKIPLAALPSNAILPERVNGVETDVIQAGHFRAHLPDVPAGQKRLRPARPGCSIGFKFPEVQSGDLMSGTLGAVVESDGTRYLLSNNHVLANENSLPAGTPIFQPGLLDGGNPASDTIAMLSQFIALTANAPNSVDCAIAALVDASAVAPLILPKVGRLKSSEPIDAVEGMAVEKTGRATGYTTGAVFDVSATISVQFDLGMLTFVDQILIRGDAGLFSDGGDSGSLVVDVASGCATGLVIGGSTQFAIANHITDVLQALNVKLVC